MPEVEQTSGQIPLSHWLLRRGVKGVPGDPRRTIEKADPQTVATYIENLAFESRNFKERHWHQVWKRNLWFTYGAQHIEQDAEGRYVPRQLTEDMRRVINVTLPAVLDWVSMKVGAKPIWSVTPRTSVPEDNERARVSERMLKGEWHHKALLPRRTLVAFSETIYGSGIIKVEHNEKGGRVVRQQVPLKDLAGRPVGEGQGGFQAEGCLEHREISPFYYHVPAGRRTPIVDDLPWCLEDPPMDLHELYLRYGIMADPDTEGLDPLYSIITDFVRLMEAPDVGVMDVRPQDQARHVQYHEKGSLVPGFEEGIRLTVVNKKVVDVRKSQLSSEGGYPYVHFCSIPREGSFWGHSKVNEAIDPQRYINEDRRLLAMARDLGAVPFLHDPYGSGIPEAAFSGGPRIITSAAPPTWLGPPPLSPALIEDTRANFEDFDRTTNKYGPGRGQIPGKAPFSGEALEMLRQSEKTTDQPELLWAAYALGLWGQKTLQLIKDHLRREQVYVLGGPSGDTESFMAGPSDIPESFLVQVQEDSALQQMKEPRRQQVLGAFQAGLYGAPEMKAQDEIFLQNLRDQADFPTSVDMIPPEHWDQRRARREAAELLLQGVAPIAKPLENHQVHLAEHIKRMNHPDFDRWPEQARMAWIEHIEQTQALLQQEQAAGMAEQFQQQVTQATTEAVSRGKFRDSEAMLVAMRGIMEGLQEKQQQAQMQMEEGEGAGQQ